MRILETRQERKQVGFFVSISLFEIRKEKYISKMSEDFGSGSSTLYDEGEKSKLIDNELHELIEIEKQKMQFNEQMHEFNSICWDTCVDRPSTKLDTKTERCLKNCVDRFIDVSLFITNRYAQMLQKNL